VTVSSFLLSAAKFFPTYSKLTDTIMGDHYVPRMYLRGFCELGSENMLWQYDKKLDCFKKVSVGTAANEKGFYTPEVENKLATQVEAPANAVFGTLRRRETIDDVARFHLAVYVATMLKRVPRFREWSRGLAQRVLPETVLRVKEQISQAAANGYITSSMESLRLAEADAVELKFKDCPPPEVIDKIRTPWPTSEMVQLIFAMNWRLFATKGPSFFLTSDNPAFFFDCYGLAGEEVELVFPISSEMVLHACWQPGSQKGIPVAEQNVVKEFNRRVASGATRFVFYRERKQWIATIAKTLPEALNRIRWQ
jgi:Protein of unknown function (DUF4238)